MQFAAGAACSLPLLQVCRKAKAGCSQILVPTAGWVATRDAFGSESEGSGERIFMESVEDAMASPQRRNSRKRKIGKFKSGRCEIQRETCLVRQPLMTHPSKV